MKLIVAQGNPEAEYASTRHNIGFRIVDAFVAEHAGKFTIKAKFNAEIAEFKIGNEKIIVAKPTTFYNETGRAVRGLVDFYKIATNLDLLIVHDDLALDFGVIRSRPKGRDAGNNGIKSVNNAIGENYHRIRVGISNELRTKMPDTDFVLGRFNAEEATALDEIIKKSVYKIDDFTNGTLQPTTT